MSSPDDFSILSRGTMSSEYIVSPYLFQWGPPDDFTLKMSTGLLPPVHAEMLHWNSIPGTARRRFNALLHEEEFTDAQIRRDQIGFVRHFLREEENEARVSLSVIMSFFGVSKRGLDCQWARYRVNSRANDLPRTLPDAAYSCIIEIVRGRFTEQKLVTYRLRQDALNGVFRF
jgi:hypothetical protein